MHEWDDARLLSAYVNRQSEEAFGVLVNRYVALVYSAAARQVQNPQLAEEVTSAAFILLAQKAATLQQRTILSGWLCRTVHFVARNALKAERRRQTRESEAHMQSLTNVPDPEVWRQFAPLLDEAVAQLNDTDRNAVVLRFYEQKPLAEVGRRLGLAPDTAQKRITRAVEKLRRFFLQRGVALPAAAIVGAVTAHSVAAAPLGLAPTISAVAVTQGAAAPPATLTLIKGTLKLMAWTKTKIAVATGIIAVLAIGTTTIIRQRPAHRAAVDKATAINQMNGARQFSLGMIMYAGDHKNRYPTNASELMEYLSKDSKLLDQFQIVFSGSQDDVKAPSSTVIIMSRQPWVSEQGTQAKAYGFADGHVEVHIAPFGPFERQHNIPLPGN